MRFHLLVSFLPENPLPVKELFVGDAISSAPCRFWHSTCKAFIDDSCPLFTANFMCDLIHNITSWGYYLIGKRECHGTHGLPCTSMKIINNVKNILIEYRNGDIYYKNQIEFSTENKFLFKLDELINFFENFEVTDNKLDIVDVKSEPKATELLFALTCLKNSFYIAGVLYDLTFAAAVSIKDDIFIMDCIKKYPYEYLYSGQVYIMPHSDLYLYKKISIKSYFKVCNRERKTIDKNKKVIIREVSFSEEFFEFWKAYYRERFQIIVNEEYLSFYKFVFKNSQFKLYKYEVNGKSVAYNVCYYSEIQRVIYDVAFPWTTYADTYRLGIFSIIVNLKRALDENWGYSLCYGKYDYKNSIMKYL